MFTGTGSENDTDAPTIGSFIKASGFDMVQKMTNFTVQEIEILNADCEEYANKRCNTGQGKKFDCRNSNVLFIMIAVLKSRGTGDFTAAVFFGRISHFFKDQFLNL